MTSCPCTGVKSYLGNSDWQTVRHLQSPDLCSQLLPVVRLLDPYGRQVLRGHSGYCGEIVTSSGEQGEVLLKAEVRQPAVYHVVRVSALLDHLSEVQSTDALLPISGASQAGGGRVVRGLGRHPVRGLPRGPHRLLAPRSSQGVSASLMSGEGRGGGLSLGRRRTIGDGGQTSLALTLMHQRS